MNVLFVSLGTHPAPGGVDTYINTAMKALNQRGHHVHLLCYSDLKFLPQERMKVIEEYKQHLVQHYLHKIPSVMIEFEVQKFAHKEMLNAFDLSKYDVIHSQSGITSQAIREVYPDKPLVGTIHSCLYTESMYGRWVANEIQAGFFRRYDHFAVDAVDKVICTSNVLDRNMVTIPEEKKEVVHSAIDTSLFYDEAKKGPKIKIATSGVFGYIKGYDVFLRALTRIRPILASHDCEIVMMGDGAERASLMAYAKEHHLNISFPGYMSKNEVAKQLSESHIFVQPSRAESFGLSVTEAMSSGCVPICSKVGGMLDQVEHMVNGLLFEAENEDELAQCLLLVITSEQTRKKLSEKAKQTVAEKFSLETFGQSLENVYEKAIAIKERKIHERDKQP